MDKSQYIFAKLAQSSNELDKAEHVFEKIAVSLKTVESAGAKSEQLLEDIKMLLKDKKAVNTVGNAVHGAGEYDTVKTLMDHGVSEDMARHFYAQRAMGDGSLTFKDYLSGQQAKKSVQMGNFNTAASNKAQYNIGLEKTDLSNKNLSATARKQLKAGYTNVPAAGTDVTNLTQKEQAAFSTVKPSTKDAPTTLQPVAKPYSKRQWNKVMKKETENTTANSAAAGAEAAAAKREAALAANREAALAANREAGSAANHEAGSAANNFSAGMQDKATKVWEMVKKNPGKAAAIGVTGIGVGALGTSMLSNNN
jgi:hypothetical protein